MSPNARTSNTRLNDGHMSRFPNRGHAGWPETISQAGPLLTTSEFLKFREFHQYGGRENERRRATITPLNFWYPADIPE